MVEYRWRTEKVAGQSGKKRDIGKTGYRKENGNAEKRDGWRDFSAIIAEVKMACKVACWCARRNWRRRTAKE